MKTHSSGPQRVRADSTVDVEQVAVRRRDDALSEQARLADDLQQSVTTSAEQASYARLRAAARHVSECDLAVKALSEPSPPSTAGDDESEQPVPRLSAAAVAARRAMHRQATDSPARRGLERDISGLLQELDALEGTAEGRALDEDEATERLTVALRLSAKVAALRSHERHASAPDFEPPEPLQGRGVRWRPPGASD